MKHSTLSPSASSRWLNCLGSIPLTKDLPRQPSSPAAAYGTRGHDVAEFLLKNDKSIFDVVELILNDQKVNLEDEDIDFLHHVQFYVDFVRSLNVAFIIEQRLPLELVTSEIDAGGTADVVAFAEDKLIVIDLKMGLGRVEVKDNTQLMIYAVAAWHEFELIHEYSQIELIIVQPRLNIVDRITYSIEDLNAFHTQVYTTGVKIHSMIKGTIPVEYTPSPKACHWCEGKAICSSLADKMFEVIEDKTSGLSKLAPWTDVARNWADSIDVQVFNELSVGRDVDGYKLVKGRKGNRKWKDEVLATEWLLSSIGDGAFKKTMISPAEANKLLGKLPEDLTFQQEGRNVVALDNDRRTKIDVQMF